MLDGLTEQHLAAIALALGAKKVSGWSPAEELLVSISRRFHLSYFAEFEVGMVRRMVTPFVRLAKPIMGGITRTVAVVLWPLEYVIERIAMMG